MARTGIAVALMGLLLGWSTPAWSYLTCQTQLKQGTNCVDVTGAASNPIFYAVSCQECTGGGSDIKCDPTEKATAAALGIKTMTNIAVAGTFAAAGVTCDIGQPLFRFSGTLGAGQYRLTIKSGGTELEIDTFTVGGGQPGSDHLPARTEAGVIIPPDGAGPGPHTEAGVPIGVDAQRFDEAGNPIAPTPPGDDGCGCAVAADPASSLWLALLLVGLAWARRRRQR